MSDWLSLLSNCNITLFQYVNNMEQIEKWMCADGDLTELLLKALEKDPDIGLFVQILFIMGSFANNLSIFWVEKKKLYGFLTNEETFMNYRILDHDDYARIQRLAFAFFGGQIQESCEGGKEEKIILCSRHVLERLHFGLFVQAFMAIVCGAHYSPISLYSMKGLFGEISSSLKDGKYGEAALGMAEKFSAQFKSTLMSDKTDYRTFPFSDRIWKKVEDGSDDKDEGEPGVLADCYGQINTGLSDSSSLDEKNDRNEGRYGAEVNSGESEPNHHCRAGGSKAKVDQSSNVVCSNLLEGGYGRKKSGGGEFTSQGCHAGSEIMADDSEYLVKDYRPRREVRRRNRISYEESSLSDCDVDISGQVKKTKLTVLGGKIPPRCSEEQTLLAGMNDEIESERGSYRSGSSEGDASEDLTDVETETESTENNQVQLDFEDPENGEKILLEEASTDESFVCEFSYDENNSIKATRDEWSEKNVSQSEVNDALYFCTTAHQRNTYN